MNSPNNILHVIHGLPADGAEQLLVDIIKKSDFKNFNHRVACVVEGGPLVKELKEFGIDVDILNKRYKADIFVIPKLINIINKNNIDILHSHMFTGYFWGTIAASLARTKVNITTNHNTAYSKTKLQLTIERILNPLTDKIINVSKEAYDSLKELGNVPEKKLEIITNGIDFERFSNVKVNEGRLKKTLGINSDKIIISMISRLFRQKGHQFFLGAAEKLLEKRKDLTFLIVGDGELRNELELYVKNSQLLSESVIFTGVRRDIAAIMKITDIFVLPSLWEGLPIVLLEAMSMGKKILATRVGGIPEVLEDIRTGRLISPGKIDDIMNGILWILNHPKESYEMSNNARKDVIERYDVSTVVKKYEDLYKKILRNK